MAVLVAAVLALSASALSAVSPASTGSVSDAVLLSGVTSVATSGTHEYATAYNAGRLTAIDVSNPGSPFISGESASTNNLLNATTVNVAGGYAYVVSKNRNGTSGSGSNDDGTGNSLTILDVATNPAQPTVVGSVRDPVNLFGAYGVAVSGHYAYVAAQGCLTGQPCPNTNVGNSFAVVDVSNPAKPTIVATLHNNSLPAPWAGTQALDHVTAVAISGNYAYVTASYSNRLTVIDISNPLSPTIVASLQDATALDFDVDVAVQNGYAYVADQASGLGRVAVVDVSSPASPKVVGTVTNSTWLNGAYRIRLHGNFAYVSAVYAETVAAIDISDPANPRVAGGYMSTATLNRTTGLDLDSSGRYLVASSPYLSTETQANYPPYAAQSGGPTNTGTISTINLDPSTLSVAITPSSEPAKTTTQTTASFAFSTNDAVASVRCALDGAAFTLCTTPAGQSYSGLGAGSHSFTVQATDAAGNTATDSYTWTITGSSGGVGPTTPVLDNFNRANGAVGSNWSLIKAGTSFATMNVSGNAASDSSATAYAWNYWSPATFGPDAEAYATIATYGSDTVRIGARVTVGSGYSGYFVSITAAGAWSIVRFDNGGSPVTLASGPTQALASGDKIAIRIVGSQVTALHYTAAGGWAQVLSYDTSHDATRYTAAGSLALEFKASTVDDFGGGTLGTTSSAPVNHSLPTVTGTATVGQQLTASPGSWTGSPTPTYGYAWQRCGSNGANCAPISGATSAAYTVASADAGTTLEIAVTASNTSGTATANSTPTAVVSATSVGPTTPVLDNFNRANGAVGSNWSLIKAGTSFATMNVSGNAASDSSATAYAWNYWSPATFGPDAEAYATIATYGSDTVRIGARVTVGSGYSGYFVSITAAGAWSIVRFDNGGSPVTLASGPTQALASGDKIAIRIVGSQVTALHYTAAGGWAQVLSYDTSHDATRYTAAGSLAVEFKASTVDDFGGGTLP